MMDIVSTAFRFTYSADDVLTLLVHLGYLTYDEQNRVIWIPNGEVRQEFINSIEDGRWEPVVQAIHSSEKLLQTTLSGDEETVAKLIEQAYQANVSILKYNNENALSCVISFAYYSAQKNYTLHREIPAGKGFADIVFEPNRNCNLPALIVDRQRSLIMLYLLQGISHIVPIADFRLSLRCNKIVQ